MNFWRIVDPNNFNTLALETHSHHTYHIFAVLLAILAAWLFLPIVERFNATQDQRKLGWLLAGSFAMAIGIWAMHFTAMLAFHIEKSVIDYNVLITLLSVIPAAIGAGITILLAKKAASSNTHLHLSALALALGIGSMHYLGMEAMEIDGVDMFYTPTYFFLSIFAAYVLALVGLYLYYHLNYFGTFFQKSYRLISSVILGLAVSAMHYIAMQATYFQRNTETIHQYIDNPEKYSQLILAISLATIVIFAFVSIVSFIDKRLSSVSNSLQESEEKFKYLAETIQAAIFTSDGAVISYTNPALEKILGYSQAFLLSMTLKDIFGKDFNDFITDILNTDLDTGEPHYALFETSTELGLQRWLYFSVTVITIDNEKQALVSAFDISEQKNAEFELHKLAYIDQLTNLPNRAMFMKTINEKISQHTKSRDPNGWIMLLDIDDFKSINDTNGHLYGDRLLIEVASRLLFLVQQSDIVARLGGDEFILYINSVDHQQSISQIADQILSSLSRPYRLAQRAIQINCSVGILEMDNSYQQADQVLHDVDIALYRAKRYRLSSWVVFDAQQDAQTKRERMLLPELKQAIENKQIEFYYQPIVDANTHTLKGFEALARWFRDDGDFVSPGEFIPIAEKSGLVAELGILAFEQACKQLSEWRQQGITGTESYYISVNIAAVSMTDERFFKTVRTSLAEHKIERGQIKLELTERMLVEDFEQITPRLNELIALGCDIMIDDFGTGYSSLSYLHLLPLSTLKIDRSFVIKLNDENGTEPLVKTIIALAQTLKLKIIAEGVENIEQAQQLDLLGVTHLQGYYFAKPMPSKDATSYLLNLNKSN